GGWRPDHHDHYVNPAGNAGHLANPGWRSVSVPADNEPVGGTARPEQHRRAECDWLVGQPKDPRVAGPGVAAPDAGSGSELEVARNAARPTRTARPATTAGWRRRFSGRRGGD